MSTPLRIAIIGAGGIAHAHARAYTAQGGGVCQLVGYADIKLAQAEGMAREYGGRAYTDAARMLDELHPDAVSVCTPPTFHAQYAGMALERSIPVLCEKPMTADAASARALAAQSRRLGVLLMPGHCHRFHGPAQALKELIAAGKLGRVLQFENRFAGRLEGVVNTWFTRKDVAGAGMLLDTGVHSLDLFRYLVGEVTWVCAQTLAAEATEVEDTGAILLRSIDGVIGGISFSWMTPPGEWTVRLYGSAGTAVLDYGVDGGALRYWTKDSGDWVQLPNPGPDRFVNEVAHFLQCVRTDAQPRVTAEDGARAIEIIDACDRSVESGCGVAV